MQHQTGQDPVQSPFGQESPHALRPGFEPPAPYLQEESIRATGVSVSLSPVGFHHEIKAQKNEPEKDGVLSAIKSWVCTGWKQTVQDGWTNGHGEKKSLTEGHSPVTAEVETLGMGREKKKIFLMAEQKTPGHRKVK